MKNVFKNFAFIGLLLSALFITSCQEEFEELPNPEEQSTLTASSSTSKLITDTCSKDGSYDNIVDGASCFAVQFPYSVNVNGLDITIDAIEDLQLIESVLDELDSDGNDLQIIFPIKITLSDYTEITINNKEELIAKAKECIEGGADDDIECIDFIYPIDVFSFNTSLEITSTTSVKSDKELRLFFAGLGDNDIVGLDFPITLEKYDGTKVTVNSNAELAAAIEDAKQMCDEDDDNDYNDDDFNEAQLDAYLVDCTFLVKEVKRNNQYQTAQYFAYTMNFTADGTVEVYNSLGGIIDGTWSTSANDEGVLLSLEFNELVDFSLEWFVYELEDGRIKLFESDGDRIILKKDCNVVVSPVNTLTSLLKECNWEIANLTISQDPIEGLIGTEFTFKVNNVVLLEVDQTIQEGTWEVSFNAESELSLRVSFADEQNLSFEWPVVALTHERVEFRITEANRILVIERNCDNANTVCGEAYIYDVIQSCRWTVSNLDGTFFEALDIDFSNENIHVYNASEVVVEEGNWEVSGSVLKFNNLTMALANYGGEWTVIQCADNLFKINRGEETLLLTKTCE